MITIIFSSLLILIFILLSGIHFYWLFGGKWGVEKVIPTKFNEKPAFETPKIATLMVGIVLLAFALVYFLKLNLITLPFSDRYINYFYWGIPSIFILRSIGEFNYLGFFKRVKNTKFANADTQFFSPLCMFIGVTGFLILI